MLSQTMHHMQVGGNSHDAKMKVKAYSIEQVTKRAGLSITMFLKLSCYYYYHHHLQYRHLHRHFIVVWQLFYCCLKLDLMCYLYFVQSALVECTFSLCSSSPPSLQTQGELGNPGLPVRPAIKPVCVYSVLYEISE